MQVLIVTSIILNVFMAVTMAVFYLGHKTFPGFVFWTTGVLATAITYGVVLLRVVIPIETSIFLTNVFWPLSGLLYLDGMRRFAGLSNLPRWIYVIPLLVAVHAISTIYYIDSGAWRTFCISVAFAIFHGLTVSIVLREYFKTKYVFLLIIGMEMLLATAIVIGRAFWNLTIHNFEFMLSINSELFFFITFIVLELAICFSFIMLNTERFERDLDVVNASLASTILKLEKALSEVKTLRGLLPICSGCKKIRDDNDNWIQMEVYVRDRTGADFSHGICPDCLRALYPEFADNILNKVNNGKKQ